MVPLLNDVVPSAESTEIVMVVAVDCPSVRFSQVAPASVEYWYPVTADPPLLTGAVKETIRV